jgi:formate hydrogenlyase subunit 3/multisubunit Na+/H+ antiporter MnhD subunit
MFFFAGLPILPMFFFKLSFIYNTSVSYINVIIIFIFFIFFLYVYYRLYNTFFVNKFSGLKKKQNTDNNDLYMYILISNVYVNLLSFFFFVFVYRSTN